MYACISYDLAQFVVIIVISGGLTENAGHENERPSKSQGVKIQDMKVMDQLQDVKMQDMPFSCLAFLRDHILHFQCPFLSCTTKSAYHHSQQPPEWALVSYRHVYVHGFYVKGTC